MAYYNDEPDAGSDWYDAEVKRHATTKADLARVTAERDELRRNAGDVRAEILDAIETVASMSANPGEKYADAVRRVGAERDALRAEVARLTAERDAHRANADRAAWSAQQAMEERDALRAEVEAMQRCVDALRDHGEARNEGEAQDALDALDTLRARKVGG